MVQVFSCFLNKTNDSYRFFHSDKIPELLDYIIDQDAKGTKFVLDSDLYKYLYKYEGNQELFYSISDLLKTKSDDNVKMAMEFMANANWTDNEIYLQEIFSEYYYTPMRGNTYKGSISFKGFLESLDFKYDGLNLSEANDYRALCKNEEHHDWIYKKYEEEFKAELDQLFKTHKMKIDKLEYSIDKSIF